MNKKGITFFYTLMLGVTIMILGLAFAFPVKESVDDSRTQLNCSWTNLSKYDEANCVGLDLLKPLTIGGIILIGVADLGARLVFGE